MVIKLKDRLREEIIIMHSAYVQAPFDEGKKTLEKANYKLISGEDNARLRIQQGEDANISKIGNYIKEGILYVPKRFGKKSGVWIPKESLIMAYSKESTEAHKNVENFYISEKQVEKALKGAVKFPKIHDMQRSINYLVPVKELANDGIMTRLFGKNAKDYGSFLKNVDINSIRCDLSPLEDKPFTNQVWFGGIDFNSALVGDLLTLGGHCMIRGVKTTGEDLSRRL